MLNFRVVDPVSHSLLILLCVIVQVCFAVVYCFLAAGVVFGFAALKPVLLQEDVYRELCSPGEVEDNVSVCAGQEIQ